MTSVVYNEIEPYCAEWLRNLVAAGKLPAGHVDERSIADLQPADCGPVFHTFAGIGGWPLALRMAGWPDNLPVWTGSCPCQPFSNAGRGDGFNDERHLWPDWFRLIRECRPPVVFGEQVDSPLGRAWLDAVFADLEGADYACGAAVLPAAGVGAPHGRHRIYFVAYSTGSRRIVGEYIQSRPLRQRVDDLDGCGISVLAHSTGGERERVGQQFEGRPVLSGNSTSDGVLGHSDESRLEGHGRSVCFNDQVGWQGEKRHCFAPSFWNDVEWLECADGKRRPAQSGLRPLAHGVPGRVGQLRGYGNAIVPPLAAAFICAAAGAISDAFGVRVLAHGDGV